MTENKTQPTGADAAAFIEAIGDDSRRADARRLCALMRRATGEEPVMWGGSIVGFGRYHYRYDSGREGDAPVASFSPRAKELVVYLPADPPDRDALLARLGKHKAAKSCLYIRSFDAIDAGVLEELVGQAAQAIRRRYGQS